MKLFASAFVAIAVLYFADLELNKGRYSQAAIATVASLARSIGVR